jgi:hypothetical protein
VQFKTLKSVSLKRASAFPFLRCETEGVAIEAASPGTPGNVAAGQINRIPDGYDPLVLQVTNESATGGGTHTETKQVQQADIDAALAALGQTLAEEFDRQIAAATGVPEGTTLFAETKALGEATPTVDPATLVGTDAEQFQLGLTAQGTVIGADADPVETLARNRIRSAVDDGFRLVEDSIQFTPGTPIVAGSIITFPVTVEALEIRIVDGDALLARVRGLGLPQARTVLQAYGQVTITVWPDWVTTIPTLEGRATLTIGEPTSPSPSTGAAAAGAVP